MKMLRAGKLFQKIDVNGSGKLTKENLEN